MRQITRLPGAARATFSTSASQSTANRVTPKPEGFGDLALFLDGVAVGDAVRRGAGGEDLMGLGQRGDIEVAAEIGQELEDFRRRIGLHRVEHLGVRQHFGEVLVVLPHDVEIDDEAGSVIGTMLEKFADTCGHATQLPDPAGGVAAEVNLLRRARPRVIAELRTSPRLLPWSG